MRLLLLLPALLMALPLGSRAGEAITPIMVEIQDSATLRIGDRSMSMADAEIWLRNTSDKFGRKDPVIINLESPKNIANALAVFSLANKTHDNVYLALRQTDDPRSASLLLSAPKDDPLAAQVRRCLDSAPRRAIPILPLDDPSLNRVRDRQADRLDKIQKGELP